MHDRSHHSDGSNLCHLVIKFAANFDYVPRMFLVQAKSLDQKFRGFKFEIQAEFK